MEDVWDEVAAAWRMRHPRKRGARMELYPHQQKAVDELSNGKILVGDVGTGKSLAAIAYFYSKVCGGVYGDMGSLRNPKDLIIITTAKKRDSLDWEGDAAKFAIGKDRMGSVANIQMTVDSWNNIGKYEEVSDAFFIFDEQRLVGSGAWTKSFVKIAKSNQWILLSATPGDTWLDYIPVFLANGFYKNRTEFKRRHVIYNSYSKFPKVDRYVETGRLAKLRNQILVEMPYQRHTVRVCKDVIVDYDKELFEKVEKRWHVYEKRPIRDVAELFSVMRKVVNSDESRLSSVRSLMRKHPKLIVFYNFDYELEILRTLQDECWSLALEFPKMTLPGPIYTTSSGTGSITPPQSERPLPNDLQMPSIPTSRSDTSNGILTPGDLASADTFMSGSNTTLITSSTGSTVQEDVGNSVMRRSKNESQRFQSALKSCDVGDQSGAEQSMPNSDTSNNTLTPVTSFAVAEWNGHKHEPIPKTDRWVYLVQYVAGAEGWNCIETDAMVFYSQTYSYKTFHQCHGRTDRLNTPFTNLYYYYLRSRSFIDNAIATSLKNKKSFNEAGFGLKL